LFATREKIGVLQQSLVINPPVFFSFSFKVGTYLPLVAPFVFPVLLTAWMLFKYFAYRCLCGKKEEDKVK
jgi:hypothetical protein